MPKNHQPTDDPIARTLAENALADVILNADAGVGDAAGWVHDLARDIVSLFEFVELDKAASKVSPGQTVPLRRLVLTGAWEVDGSALGRTRPVAEED